MKRYEQYETILADKQGVRENYYLMTSLILPRPIAFVSTISPDGRRNLAPFSFFAGIGANPPSVLFCPCNRRDGSQKDTLRNVRAVGECVINVVPYEIREPMNAASFDFPPEVDEFEHCGFTPLPSRLVRPPRIAESPVQMECRLMQIVPVGSGPLGANVVICQVLCFHLAAGLRDQRGGVDPGRLDLVGRLGGGLYTLTRERFDLPRPKSEPPRASESGTLPQ
jgi:flavin reductase (DIM6/NTAB) family NADH-FMN oxidoreductase RutF